MNKKATIIKVIATILQIVPVLIALGFCGPAIISRWDKTLSVAAIVAIIIIILIFKDATKRFISTPSAFKFSIAILIFVLIAMSLGEQLLIISVSSVISGIICLPLNMWYNYLVRPLTSEEMKTIMENNNDEKSI